MAIMTRLMQACLYYARKKNRRRRALPRALLSTRCHMTAIATKI